MTRNSIYGSTWVALLITALPVALGQTPMGTAFSYQGQLKNSGAPVNDLCAFQFKLFDSAMPPETQIGSTQTLTGVEVVNGLFMVTLDFGTGAFNGDARWLEIEVKGSADPGYTILHPRQALPPTPYAQYAKTAGDSSTLGGRTVGNAAGQIPLNNGTVSSTLNADQLDGQHAAAFAASSHSHTFLDAPGDDYDNVVEVNANGKVAIGTDPPMSSATLYVSGGSLAQWDAGYVGGYGKTSVYTMNGTLNASGDFYFNIYRDLWQPYFNDNFIFKVEVFVCLDPYSLYPHSNRGSAYSMALIGKQRGAGLVHFYEAITHSNDATITFSYSSPVTDNLMISVNTDRASGTPWYTMVKLSY